jgi:predicted heme/steroid binding protein
MRGLDFTNKRLIYILAEINHDIDLLYVIPCVYTRNLILNHLRDRISQLEAATEAVNQPVQLQTNTLPSKVTAAPAQGTITTVQQMAQGNERVLTLQELSGFDGKNGRPAYVSVGGTVYDVTNNAAWAAATHFGLAAGRDLTGEFNSCHAGQPILNNLKVVGRLV